MKNRNITFVVSDDWHVIHRFEWIATVVDVEHGIARDVYSMDHELEWKRAQEHYSNAGHAVESLSLVMVLMATTNPLSGKLGIVDVLDKVAPTSREIELAELGA